MKKKLTAKVQEINPQLQQFSTSFAHCLVVEPESKDISLKKGSIYAVYEVTGSANFDTSLTNTALRDILHNSYYQSDNISPIQSLEKAIMEAREKILQLSNDALSAEPTNIQLNISAGVLWGNVFYAVQFGEADGFLMRDGVVKPIEAVSEGSFAAASGIVRDEDVVILSSRSFSQIYPPQKLPTTRISEQNLKENEACILLKFIVDTSFTEEETIDFGLEKQASKNRRREQVQKILLGARRNVERAAPLANKIKEILSRRKKSNTQLDISGIGKIPKTRLPKEKKLPKKFAFLLPILGLVLIIVLGIQLLGQKKTETSATPPLTVEKTETPASQVDVNEITKDDGQYKVLRVDPEIFYDIKITDQNAQPREIAAVGNFIVVADPSSGIIYKSSMETAKFETETTAYPGLKSLINVDGTLGFLQNNKYFAYNLSDSTKTLSYDIAGTNILGTYSDYLYGIVDDKLIRYEKDGNKYTETLWGQSAEFQNARSITVAYSIYLLTKNGELTKHTSGNKNTFEIKGLNNDLSGATKVLTTIDFDYIYVLDPANQRVVVLDFEGNLVKQYTHQPLTSWEDLRDMTVTSDETALYLLNGSKVMKIGLENGQ
ncbi:MAG: hypothetical protein KatS3mg101_0042 [Patescibacteria group bacterium]|nr:MAG: hypothetical protein KatS3mg101_0042 [Patescibacteria group bacterium]